MVTFFFLSQECGISVSFLTLKKKNTKHFITVREFTYSLQSAFINSTNIVKIEQLYFNDRAKYFVRGMKQMALLLISWRIISFIKATFPGSETQQGLSVNKLKLPSKLCNVIHSVSVFHMVMCTLYVIFPCSEKFLELDPTPLHTNVNRKTQGN